MPVWSKDGQSIAFISNRRNQSRFEILIINIRDLKIRGTSVFVNRNSSLQYLKNGNLAFQISGNNLGILSRSGISRFSGPDDSYPNLNPTGANRVAYSKKINLSQIYL